MHIVTPTLHFRGQCEEAHTLYAEAFGMKTDHILHYSDAKKEDWDVTLSEKEKRLVYHSEGYVGTQRFMLADDMSIDGHEVTSIFLTLTFDTADEVRCAFGKLAEDGRILNPLTSTTYSSCMGAVVDRFGFRWGLMTETN